MSKEDINLLYAAEIGLCLKEISVPKMFLEDCLRKMAKHLQTVADNREDLTAKKLSCYAQILHAALLSINAAEDAVSGLSLLILENEKQDKSEE